VFEAPFARTPNRLLRKLTHLRQASDALKVHTCAFSIENALAFGIYLWPEFLIHL
jgi:hypothetical protein